jgi:HlyD family secretion protein
MQIESWVGELDIASIKEDQPVRFTLESLPGRNYQGTVESKRLMPSVQDNVVSYKVIISVENPDGSLLPGMTCSVEFIEERSENILLVSNAALRFQPSGLSAAEISGLVFNAGLKNMDETQRAAAVAARAEAQQQTAQAGGGQNAQAGLAGLVAPQLGRGGGRMMGGGGAGGNRNQAQADGAPAAAPPSPPKPLWYIDGGGKPACILVRAGSSDGSHTEVIPLSRDESLEGMSVILKEKVQS